MVGIGSGDVIHNVMPNVKMIKLMLLLPLCSTHKLLANYVLHDFHVLFTQCDLCFLLLILAVWLVVRELFMEWVTRMDMDMEWISGGYGYLFVKIFGVEWVMG